ncbi:MAG: TetR family transcriptional regulator [Hungatella sp.]|nr:TetR family transcriptional regulator [Hungatella sp.]
MNTSGDKKEKLSTRRTYLLLSRSLFALLEDTPFEKISLTQLCDHSMVPRSTFYRYFEDKYDLLYYCLQTFFDDADLDEDVVYLRDGKSKKFVTKLIMVMDKNKEAFRKIWKTNKGGIFMDILRDYLIQVLNQKLDELTRTGHRLKISQTVFTYLLADLYMSMGKCYLELEEGIQAEEFVEQACRFVEKGFFGD